ncbi:TOBE domain-containing protein [Chloroherpeton thalassium]|nr:TOBE domain-containing protein [Chloroherpeton thalassium]
MPKKNRQSRTTRDSISLQSALCFQKDDNVFLGHDRIALLEKIQELGSISQAAKAVGISYKTAWHLVDMMNNLAEKPLVERTTGGKGGGGTILTEDGQRAISQFHIIAEEHQKFLHNLEDRLGDTHNLYQFLRRISMKISARNVLNGTVSAIIKGAVNSEIILSVGEKTKIVSIITNGAVENLGLKEGMNAYAIIKSSSVIIGTDLEGAKISSRNILCGTIAKVIEGAVNTEVDLKTTDGNVISAIVTHESAKTLGLKEGGQACAFFKASSVILGVI